MRPRLLPLLLIFPLGLVLAQNKDQGQTVTPPASERVEVLFGKPLVRSYEAMIADLGATIYPEDFVVTFPDPALGLGSKITIYRATPIWVDDGGSRTLIRTFAKTVNDLLGEKGIVLGAQDKIEPAMEGSLTWEGTITIVRVEETEVVEKESIPFKTVTKDDSTIYQGTTKTEQEGKRGEKEVTYKVRRENGKEVSREKLSEKVLTEPVDKIVLKGTKPLPVLGSGLATWYRYKPGYFAAHRTLPLGTRVLVRSVANPDRTVIVTINDRGPFGEGRIIDLQAEAFLQLAPLSAGIIQVTLEQVP